VTGELHDALKSRLRAGLQAQVPDALPPGVGDLEAPLRAECEVVVDPGGFRLRPGEGGDSM
jgi:hypothetical protein